jgi:predicted ArsR family transcriptional regulator
MLDRVVGMLDALGFQPQLTDDCTAIRLHHCPFHELVPDHPTSSAASTSR